MEIRNSPQNSFEFPSTNPKYQLNTFLMVSGAHVHTQNHLDWFSLTPSSLEATSRLMFCTCDKHLEAFSCTVIDIMHTICKKSFLESSPEISNYYTLGNMYNLWDTFLGHTWMVDILNVEGGGSSKWAHPFFSTPPLTPIFSSSSFSPFSTHNLWPIP